MLKNTSAHIRQRIFTLVDDKKEDLPKFCKSRYMKEYIPQYLKQKKRFNLTFEINDFKRIEAHAKACGLTPTAFLRESVLYYLAGTRLPTDDEKQALSELIFLLRNLGNNLNQIAKHCNTYQKLVFGNFMHTRKLLADLEAIVETAVKDR